MNAFKNEIKNTSWQNILSSNNSTLSYSYNNFFDLFSTAYEKNFPLLKTKVKMKIDKNKSPWMTKCISKSTKRKHKLYKKYLQDPSVKNENKYKRYKNKLNHIINAAKKYYEWELIEYKQDTRLLWKTLNEIMNGHTKKSTLPREFNGSNPEEIIWNPSIIANKFNEYFINVGLAVAKKIPNSNRTFCEFLPRKYRDSFFLDPVTEYELEFEIKKLKTKKSPGYDKIKTDIIKNVASDISEPLTHIFNLIFLNGNIPDDLKKALASPIFKENQNNAFRNYLYQFSLVSQNY